MSEKLVHDSKQKITKSCPSSIILITAVFILLFANSGCLASTYSQIIMNFSGIHGSDNTFSTGNVQSGTIDKHETIRPESRKNQTHKTEEIKSLMLPELRKPIEERLSTYKEGSIFFTPEPKMQVLEWKKIDVIISPEKINAELISRIKSKYGKNIFIQYTSLMHVGEFMRVYLYADNPDDFSIDPKQPITFYILDKEIKHTFQVKPLRLGKKTLHLKVSLVLKNNELTDMFETEYPELTRQIEVQVFNHWMEFYLVPILDIIMKYKDVILPVFACLGWLKRRAIMKYCKRICSYINEHMFR